jgi:hypothetical protein
MATRYQSAGLALHDPAQSLPAWISDRLAALGREHIAVSATLVNRRIEATKKVVDLSRWFNGNGALFRATEPT